MTYAEDKRGFGVGDKLPEPVVSKWGILQWEIPDAFRGDTGRVELDEFGKIGLFGIPNPIEDLLTAQRVAQALVAAVEYRRTH